MRKPSVVPPRPASKVAECDGFRKKTVGVAAIGRTTEGFLGTCHVGRGQGLLTSINLLLNIINRGIINPIWGNNHPMMFP